MATFPGKVEHGIGRYRAASWRDMQKFLEERLDYGSVVWRGQHKSSWVLNSTLDRVMDRTFPFDEEEFAADHLATFRYACRGRRGPSPRALDDDEMWSLGQHFGLATPLLDWTLSPYVALFFAYEHPSGENPEDQAIFGIKERSIAKKSAELVKDPKTEKDAIRFVRPLTDENPRLLSQGGLFTRAPLGIDIEEWVEKHFKDDSTIVLYKITIPDGERDFILKTLNRMNINHLSLFPDVAGASLYCNLRAEVSRY